MTNREMFAEYHEILTVEDLQKMLHDGKSTIHMMLKENYKVQIHCNIL